MNIVDQFGLASVKSEVILLLSSLLAGGGIIAIYTLYSALVNKLFSRMKRKAKRWLYGLVDALFWIAASYALFYMFYKINDAVLRFYSLAWLGIGVLIAYNIKRAILRRLKNRQIAKKQQ